MDEAGVLPARHRLDAGDFHRMAEAGIFGRRDRIELIDGELFDMAPIGQGHEAMVGGLTEAFVLACAGRAHVWVQNSLRLDRLNVLQPDFAILRRRTDFYAKGERPGPADVLLLVEVADSSLNFDRAMKLPLYARACIGEFWIVDLKHHAVDTFRKPSGDQFGEMTTHRSGDRFALALAPDIIVSLDLVFG